jgi:hypothetical protein
MKIRSFSYVVALLITCNFCFAQVNGIRSFRTKPAELKPELLTLLKGDYIELTDDKDSVRIFSVGDIVYLAHYAPEMFAPESGRMLTYWVLWPILSLDTLASATDSTARLFFQADMDFVTVSSKKILKVEWIYKNTSTKRQVEKQGLQLWELGSATCYFDELTRNYDKTVITGKTDACILKAAIENGFFVMTINGCNKNMVVGRYKLEDQLVLVN